MLGVLVTVSLACSITEDSGPDLQATNHALQRTSDALSHQATQAAQSPLPQQQSSPPPIPKPPVEQPTQAAPASQPTQAQPPQQNRMDGGGGFDIVNDSTSDIICYFYMAASSESEWGPDRLDDMIILPGEIFTLTDVPYDIYDAIALDCEEYILGEVYGFDFPPNDTFTLFDDSASEP